MNTVLPLERQAEIFDQVIRDITQRAAGINLCPGETEPNGELFTVHAVFDRGFPISLSLLAEASMFVRLTRCMMQKDEVTPQDVEIFTKEYFNVLCGHIASRLYQETKIPVRFGIPAFYQGRYSPEDHSEHIVLTYISDGNESAQLIHHTPFA